MRWEPLKERLEHILNAGMHFATIPESEWHPDADSMDIDRRVHFRLYRQGDAIVTLSVEAVFLTPSERQLIELMVRAYRERDRMSAGYDHEDEKNRVIQLRNWIFEQLDQGAPNRELPEMFSTQGLLFTVRVPLLLYGETQESGNTDDDELKKLLESFFDAEVLLVPLMEKEWLILAPEEVLSASLEEDRGGDGEAVEESLESLGLGLHEMLASEWIGDSHLSVDYPMVPAKDLVSTVIRLREAVALGRQYHMGNHIHFLWQLQLEKLLNLLPDEEKKRFAEQILKRMDYAMDSETLQTLEQFFDLDCNVSETAKKLYIHRNTLLYRLDKFKQETGLDVRTFSHAVLVKIALLLYKVTKRK